MKIKLMIALLFLSTTVTASPDDVGYIKVCRSISKKASDKQQCNKVSDALKDFKGFGNVKSIYDFCIAVRSPHLDFKTMWIDDYEQMEWVVVKEITGK